MPLSNTSISQAILAAGPDLRGPSWVKLTVVVGSAVAAWARLPTSLSMQGVTAGVLGSGVVTGKIVVPATPLPVAVAAATASMLGVSASSVARAVGVGVATAFTTSAAYRGVSVGVGAGTDVSRVFLSNGPALVAALGVAARAGGLTGVSLPLILSGLGTGIASLVRLGTGVGVVAGPAGPLPGAGTSLSGVY